VAYDASYAAAESCSLHVLLPQSGAEHCFGFITLHHIAEVLPLLPLLPLLTLAESRVTHVHCHALPHLQRCACCVTSAASAVL
jgi:hypothetical protein